MLVALQVFTDLSTETCVDEDALNAPTMLAAVGNGLRNLVGLLLICECKCVLASLCRLMSMHD